MGTITKTIGTTGRDYTTLAAWEAALPANLVTDGNSYIGQCFNDSEFSSASNLVTISGLTTDGTHTITLTTGAGQSFRDNANAQTNALRYNQSNGVGIKCTGGYLSGAVVSSTNNTTISNLQIASTGTATKPLSLSGVFTLADNLIMEVKGRGNVNDQLLTIAGGSLRNSILIDRYASGGDTLLSFGSQGKAYNCTLVVPSDLTAATYGAKAYYGSGTMENCAVFGCTNAVNGTLGTSTTNMTDVASPPSGFTGGKTYANQFQTTTDASRDFRLKSGADLINAGTTDSTNGANDIVGTARPSGASYDIGAWEFVSAGGGPTPKPCTLAMMGVG